MDVGFRTLDPFGPSAKGGALEVDGLAIAAQRLGVIHRESPNEEVELLLESDVQSEEVPCTHLEARKSNVRGKLSPCCVRQGRLGPEQATRLEEIEDRIRGKILDNMCQSML